MTWRRAAAQPAGHAVMGIDRRRVRRVGAHRRRMRRPPLLKPLRREESAHVALEGHPTDFVDFAMIDAAVRGEGGEGVEALLPG